MEAKVNQRPHGGELELAAAGRKNKNTSLF
jgi:hypothetical protein